MPFAYGVRKRRRRGRLVLTIVASAVLLAWLTQVLIQIMGKLWDLHDSPEVTDDVTVKFSLSFFILLASGLASATITIAFLSRPSESEEEKASNVP